MSEHLESVQWGEFRISEVFEIVDGYYNKKPPQDKNGTIPFLGATQYDNGITTFYNKETVLNYDKVGDRTQKDIEKRIFKGNCIAITNNGSVGNAYYQKSDFVCSHDVTPIYLKIHTLNIHIALFIIPLLQQSGRSFEYAKKWRPKRMRKSKILLPIDSKGNPNWQFMESYMKQIEQKHIEKILAYYADKYGGGGNPSYCNSPKDYKHIFIEDGLMKIAQEKLNLENMEWGEFIIGEIFEVKATISGIDKNKLNNKEGNYPYITRSDKLNGIDDFIGKQDTYKHNHGNVITIGLDTQTAFYQNATFYTGQNIQILKYEEINKYNALFIIILLKKFMEKFSWGGNGATLTRLKRGKILLPLDSNGKPDYQFMESYMKTLEAEHLEKITAYYNAKLNKFNNVTINNISSATTGGGG